VDRPKWTTLKQEGRDGDALDLLRQAFSLAPYDAASNGSNVIDAVGAIGDCKTVDGKVAETDVFEAELKVNIEAAMPERGGSVSMVTPELKGNTTYDAAADCLHYLNLLETLISQLLRL